MTAGIIALCMTVGFVLLWATSKGNDRVRLAFGALWGFTLSAALGKYVLAVLGMVFKALGTLFGI